MSILIRSSVLLAVLIALSGCRSLSSSCNAPPSYGTGEDRPPLKIPAGMEEPDMRNALRIPELNEPERPRTQKDSCLEEPPKYSSTAVIEEKKEEK